MKRLQIALLAGVLVVLPTGGAMAAHGRTVHTDPHTAFGHRMHRGSCTRFGATFKTSVCSHGSRIQEHVPTGTIRTHSTATAKGPLVDVPCPSTTTCLAIDSLFDVSAWPVVWSGTPCAVRRAPGRFVAHP